MGFSIDQYLLRLRRSQELHPHSVSGAQQTPAEATLPWLSSSDDLDGTGCVAHDRARDAPEQPALHACPAVRADHDQICSPFVGLVNDGGSRVALAHSRVRGYAGGVHGIGCASGEMFGICGLQPSYVLERGSREDEFRRGWGVRLNHR